MKLNAETVEVETEGFTSTGFGVNVDDPAVIQILTQGIYNDPWIWPRELLANAADAGGAVSLVLPEALSSDWIVEDHGPGMDDEFMSTRYTRIFDSTKRGDNLKTGGFGHGRLSPLAYTDSYSVRSRYMHEGRVMEGNYVIFKGEDKIPRITRVSLGLSDVAQTGVTVTVPVANSDIKKISGRTRFYGAYSKPTPPEIEPTKYEFTGSTGAVRPPGTDNLPEFNGLRVIMGGVPYPAPSGQFGKEIRCDLFFAIGELEPTLSRDSIKNSTEVEKLIRERFKTLQTEYSAAIQKQIDVETTVLDRYAKYHSIRDKMDWQMQSYFMPSSAGSAELKTDLILKAAKGDFAVHSLNSDVDRSIWNGMDEETKAFKSLAALKVFMLNSGGVVSRREGVEAKAKDQINMTSFVSTYNRNVSDAKINVVMFAVPLPYTQGQIKHIRGAMAKKLAELRTADKIKSEVGICLVQYTDKKDAEAIAGLITKKMDIHFIDDKSAIAGAARYIPTIQIAGGDSKVTRKAVSTKVLSSKLKDTYYLIDETMRENDVSGKLRQIHLLMRDNLNDKDLIAVSKANEKFLPAGWLNIKDQVVAYIKNDYGYPYDLAAMDKLHQQESASNNDANLNILSLSLGADRKKTLGENLLEDARIKARPDIFQPIEKAEGVRQRTGSYGSPYVDIMDKLRVINSLISYSVIAKDDLPPASKPLPTPQTGDGALVSAFKKKYLFLPAIESQWRYNYRSTTPPDLYDHIVTYLTSI